MSNLTKNILIALGIALLLGSGFMIMSNSSDDASTNDTPANNQKSNDDVTRQAEKYLADIRKVESYLKDLSIFSRSEFRALNDFRTNLPDVPTGRSNPFVPVE